MLAAVLGGCTPALQSETGVVLSVDSSSPVNVSGFTLRTDDGRQVVFVTDAVAFDQSGFPPEHLREHLALASPVKVTYRVTDGHNSVVRLEDAPSAGAPQAGSEATVHVRPGARSDG